MATVSNIEVARGLSGTAASGAAPEREGVQPGRVEVVLSASTVVVLDPDPLLREAWLSLVQRLNTHADVIAVGTVDEICNVSEAVRRRVDLALVNTTHARITAPASLRSLEKLAEVLPQCPIVCIVGRVKPSDIVAGTKQRIRGFIPTSMSAAVAAHALNLVNAGGTFVPDSVVLGDDASPDDLTDMKSENGASLPVLPSDVSFTPRQSQVLELLRLGLQNKVIAYELGMRESTVKIHIRHIMRKLKVHSRTQVALYAQQLVQLET